MGAGIRSRPTETVKLTGRNRQGLAKDLQLLNPSHFPTRWRSFVHAPTPVLRYCLLFSCVHPRASAAAPQMKSASYLLPLTTHLQVALLGLLDLADLDRWPDSFSCLEITSQLVGRWPASQGKQRPIMLCNPPAEAWLAAKACPVWPA